jgi:hypothetical protein
MFRLKTINAPRGKLVRDTYGDECARVYQTSYDVTLQLWSGKRYMLVQLSAAEARAIAEQLVKVADNITGG